MTTVATHHAAGKTKSPEYPPSNHLEDDDMEQEEEEEEEEEEEQEEQEEGAIVVAKKIANGDKKKRIVKDASCEWVTDIPVIENKGNARAEDTLYYTEAINFVDGSNQFAHVNKGFKKYVYKHTFKCAGITGSKAKKRLVRDLSQKFKKITRANVDKNGLVSYIAVIANTPMINVTDIYVDLSSNNLIRQ